MTTERMERNFKNFTPSELPERHRIVGVALGTRLQRIERVSHGWRLWIATRDFINGTHLELCENGCILYMVTREGEGDEIRQARPTDDNIQRMLWQEAEAGKSAERGERSNE